MGGCGLATSWLRPGLHAAPATQAPNVHTISTAWLRFAHQAKPSERHRAASGHHGPMCGMATRTPARPFVFPRLPRRPVQLRYANNSNYKNDTIIRKEVHVGSAVLGELERIIEDAGIMQVRLVLLFWGLCCSTQMCELPVLCRYAALDTIATDRAVPGRAARPRRGRRIFSSGGQCMHSALSSTLTKAQPRQVCRRTTPSGRSRTGRGGRSWRSSSAATTSPSPPPSSAPWCRRGPPLHLRHAACFTTLCLFSFLRVALCF